MNRDRRRDYLLLLSINLLISALYSNRSLPIESLGILAELDQGRYLDGPNFGYKIMLGGLHACSAWTGVSLVTLGAACNAIAAAAATLLSYEFYRLQGHAREGARLSALAIALCPAVVLGVNVFGPQGLLFFGLALSFFALARAAQFHWHRGQALLLLSLLFSFSIDRSALLIPVGWILFHLIKPPGREGIRKGLQSTVYCLAAASAIALIDDEVRAYFLTDLLRGIGPLAWIGCIAFFSSHMRFAAALYFAASILFAANASSTELSGQHDGWTLLPLLWPLALISKGLLSPTACRVLLLTSLLLGIARLSMYDESSQAELLQSGITSLIDTDDAVLMILGSPEELALVRLALPEVEARLIQNIVNFAELRAAEEHKGGAMETLLLAQLSNRAGDGRRIFLSRAAEDQLRNPLFRSQHGLALRVFALLKDSFDWTFVQAGVFQGQELRLQT